MVSPCDNPVMSDDRRGSVIPFNPRGAGYPDDVRELAFETWAYRADRSIQKTLDILGRELEPRLIPDRRTIDRWRRHDDWDGEVTRRIQAVAPRTMENYAARFVELVGRAQDVIADGLSSDKRDGSIKPGVFAAMQMQAKELHGLYWQMLQAGTAAKLAADASHVDTADELDPNERARRLRDRIAKENRRP